MNIIKALKENEKPFGLMSEEMRREFKRIQGEGTRNHLQFWNEDEWQIASSPTWNGSRIYRLRPDYEEKPEIVECEVMINSNGELACAYEGFNEDACCPLSDCVNDPDFIGFKYEDDRMDTPIKRSACPRLYVVNGSTSETLGSQSFDKAEVLTPTHVLFRSTK
jgi:hypothetical protein